MHLASPIRRRSGLLLAALLIIAAFIGTPHAARAGGQGRDIPPYVLPVRQTELRLASQARMVCVADPGTVCVAPYLDAPPSAVNTDGGTFRSAACPGGPPHGACRPDYIAGAEITGELIVSWPITRTPPDPLPSPDPSPSEVCFSPEYKICQVGHIELNVTAPGVAVSNPIWEMDSTDPEYTGNECNCLHPDFDADSNFNGERIDRYWQTRNVGASCDIALEYSEILVSRERLLEIGQQAFPALLCQADASGACTLQPVPVLVEPDGSLTKGCGSMPSNTFAIRFAEPNEPLAFVRKPQPIPFPNSPPPGPKDVADVTGDGNADLHDPTGGVVLVNDGNNRFTREPSGLFNIFGGAVVTDWTDDGDPDLVASPTGVVKVYPGDGAGTFDDPSSFSIDGTGASELRAEDLNGDTLPDAVAVAISGSTTRVIWNQGGAPVSPAVDPLTVKSDSLVDFDGDTDTDVLGTSSSAPADVRWASNGGPGGFSEQTAVSIPTSADALVPILTQEIVDVLRCDAYSSSCCTDHGGVGCDDTTCETIVCNWDPDCCDLSYGWTESCKVTALEQCSVCMDPATPDCCYEHSTTGCDLPSCETIVTTLRNSCASGPWDDFCAEKARGWCNECHEYNVVCTTTLADVDGADADGDGDTDLFVSVNVDLEMVHSSPNSDRDGAAGYFAWLPNLQGGGATPIFDPGIEPWRLLGPAAADLDSSLGGQLEMVDLDGDTDPDAVGVGFWYRNEGGSFTGPHLLGLGSVSQGCGVDGLVGYWRFSGNADDATGCASDGVVSGAMLAPDVDGTADSAYAFDGVDDYIDLGTSSALKPPLPVTISAYLKNECPAATNCWIFENDAYPTSYVGVSFAISDNGLYAQYGDGNGASSISRRSATTFTLLSPGVWYHVAVVIAGPTDFRFYVDGIRVDPGQVVLGGTGGSMVYFGNDAQIGLDGGVFNAHFDGDLDEVRFYARALGEEEIQALPGAGAPLSASLLDPSEKLEIDTLFVRDLDGDADLDVVGANELWERVEPLPEPGASILLGAGIATLFLLVRRRARG